MNEMIRILNVEPIRRGQIYYIDNRFAYNAKGDEKERRHPYIIMSDDDIIMRHKKVIALQITSMVGKNLDFAVPIILTNHYVTYIKIQEYEIDYSAIKKSQYEGTIIGNDLLSSAEFMDMISDLMIMNRFGVAACKMSDIVNMYNWYVDEFWKNNKKKN